MTWSTYIQDSSSKAARTLSNFCYGQCKSNNEDAIKIQLLSLLLNCNCLLQEEYVSPRVINLMLRYLTHAIELGPTWKLIKPHIHSLLTKCVFDLMCFDNEDAELWEEDPQEYIRKVGDNGVIYLTLEISCGTGSIKYPQNIT